MASKRSFRSTVLLVALLNLVFFAVEVVASQVIGSVSLLADSLDFLEDASVNFLIFLSVSWTLLARNRLARFLALLLLVPATMTIITAIGKGFSPETPEPIALSLISLAALAVNLYCAYSLARHRETDGTLIQAAWLAARNDAIANVAIFLGAMLSLVIRTGWIDIAIGVGIFILNADAAMVILRHARLESKENQGESKKR